MCTGLPASRSDRRSGTLRILGRGLAAAVSEDGRTGVAIETRQSRDPLDRLPITASVPVVEALPIRWVL